MTAAIAPRTTDASVSPCRISSDPDRSARFSTGATGKSGNVDRLARAVMEQSGQPYEFVKLTDLTYSGCKGCVHLCARPQVCKLQDDLLSYYARILEADAVVLGSPVYFGSINAQAISFIERFFGYRHVSVAIDGEEAGGLAGPYTWASSAGHTFPDEASSSPSGRAAGG